jgi:hypothetical protein
MYPGTPILEGVGIWRGGERRVQKRISHTPARGLRHTVGLGGWAHGPPDQPVGASSGPSRPIHCSAVPLWLALQLVPILLQPVLTLTGALLKRSRCVSAAGLP